jgi:hypothetical protein
MQLIYESLGKSFVVGSREYKEHMFGRPQNLTVVTDESGEVVNFYRHREDAEHNEQLVKSLRDKYPGEPLMKCLDLHQNEMMLKASRVLVKKPETASEMRKSFKPILDKLAQLGRQPPAKKSKREKLMESYGL